MARYSYKRALDELKVYAESEGFKRVRFNAKDSKVSWMKGGLNEPKYLDIGSGMTLENQVYVMLHELGHHELRKDWEWFSLRFPVAAHAEEVYMATKDKKYTRRTAFMVSCLEEEFLAWDEGLRLGIEMGIKVRMDKFIDIKSKCLKCYIGYYAQLKA